MKRKARGPFVGMPTIGSAFVFICLLAVFVLGGMADTDARDMQRKPVAAQSYSVPFARAWSAILAEAGIEAEFVTASPGRLRRMFADGIVQLDCCTTPVWRTRPEEMAVQLWSDTFYISRDMYIFAAGRARAIAGPEDLSDLRVAVVLGYDYIGQEHFGARIPGQNFADVLALVAMGRADVGIVSEIDFRALTEDRPGVFEPGGVHMAAEQKVRVHKMAAALLPRINAAIAALKADGRLSALIEGAPDQPAR